MRVLVTGATGLIGNAIAKRLVARGDEVVALVRDPSSAARLLPESVVRVRGDITDPGTLPEALRDVELVFHAAGMPEQWQRDETIFDRVNRVGTANVLAAAAAAGVRRVVYTSTMDVFAAPRGGTLVEGNVDPNPKPTAYERSKQAAEREAERVRGRGLEVVFVNPAAVYGPSPVNIGLNSFFIKLMKREAPVLPPGGMSVVYVDGVADAHVAAAERGVDGERYLVADTHVSNRELAEAVAKHAGLRSVPKVAPAVAVKALAQVSAPLARAFGFTPLVAPGQLSFLLWDVRVDASKAREKLGFVPTPLEDGVKRTVEFLRATGAV